MSEMNWPLQGHWRKLNPQLSSQLPNVNIVNIVKYLISLEYTPLCPLGVWVNGFGTTDLGSNYTYPLKVEERLEILSVLICLKLTPKPYQTNKEWCSLNSGRREEISLRKNLHSSCHSPSKLLLSSLMNFLCISVGQVALESFTSSQSSG